MLQDMGREDIDPIEFHKQWDNKMFPFHRHVEKAHRFLPISDIMTKCLRKALKEHEINIDNNRLEKYITMTRNSFINLGIPFDDTRPALESLRDQGCDLHVISNADLDLHKQLARMRLTSFFKCVITSYEARSYKPLRPIFLKALSLVHCTADDAVMVGDSIENDIVGASRVGMTTVLIDRSPTCGPRKTTIHHARPDYVVNDLRKIGTKMKI
jgi:HAD superfamily hydrolase (TIGR01549 family)